MSQSIEIQIIKVQHKDSQKLLQIGRQTFYDGFGPPVNTEENIQSYLNEKFTKEHITKELKHPNSIFYFAKLNNEIIGYLKLNSGDAQTESVEGNAIEIERIYVTKEYQGKKTGQILLDKSLQVAKNKNAEYIWLGVWDKNVRAIKFYERNGFKIFDKHGFMLGTEAQVDLMMKLEL